MEDGTEGLCLTARAHHAVCFCSAVQAWLPLLAMQHAASVHTQLGCKAQADVLKALHSATSRHAAEVAPDPEEEEQQQEPEGRPEHKFVYRLLKKPEIGRDLVGQKVKAALWYGAEP